MAVRVPVDGGRGVVDGAVDAVLAHLSRTTGLRLWLFARHDGDRWDVQRTSGHDDVVRPGTSWRWLDTYCTHMIEGKAPQVAPDARAVPVYAQAAINSSTRIGAYLGAPVVDSGGRLIGTLCALDPEPQDDGLHGLLPLVDLCADLLGRLFAVHDQVVDLRGAVEAAETRSRTDGLTGVANRRAWDEALALEEARCARTGASAAVVSVDLDGLKETNDHEGHGAGDDLLRRASRAMAAVLRQQDLLARLGGDEFGVLATDCDSAEAAALAGRLTDALRASGVSASLAATTRSPDADLSRAWHEADQAMYAVKSRRAEATAAQHPSEVTG